MAKGIFFMSWELWQQMTFALAVSIAAVFAAGLVKLWWTNRIVRKQEILDEEKKARIDDMRSSGIRPNSSKRAAASSIPFGVRAIQSGVQVDGIWISRPATPTETTKLTSEKTKMMATVTTSQRLTDSESFESNSSGAIPTPVSRDQRHYYAPHRQHNNGLRTPTPNALNEDTLRRLEGGQDGAAQPQRPPVYDIYVPTTSSSRPQQEVGSRGNQRGTGSSESGDSSADSSAQKHRFERSGSGRSYVSSSSGSGGGGEREGGRLYAPPSHGPYQQQHQGHAEASSIVPAAPEPTFGPGDLHYAANNNRSMAARRVNDGFEVQPVGRLGTPGTIEPSRVKRYNFNGEEGREDGDEEGGPAWDRSGPGYGRR